MTELTESERAIITKYDLYFEERVSRLEVTTQKIENDMASLKDNIKEIKSEMKDLRIVMITGFILSALLMAYGFKWI